MEQREKVVVLTAQSEYEITWMPHTKKLFLHGEDGDAALLDVEVAEQLANDLLMFVQNSKGGN